MDILFDRYVLADKNEYSDYRSISEVLKVFKADVGVQIIKTKDTVIIIQNVCGIDELLIYRVKVEEVS